jgi:nucleotide-binding universal stress UspA family protein
MSGEDELKRFLVAVDGSDHSDRAVRLAATIAKGLNAEISLLYVMEMREMPTLIAEAEAVDSEQRGRSVLSDSAEIAMSEGMATKTVLLRGQAANQVTRYANENKIQMIFTGSRGRGGAKALLLGSVSQGILQGAKCPVVVVK